jgi:hypothetical protein
LSDHRHWISCEHAPQDEELGFPLNIAQVLAANPQLSSQKLAWR